jgi:hypothetical protein
LGYHKISTLDAVRGLGYGLAGGIPSRAVAALVRAEGANVRWRDDGTDPTAALGMLLATTDAQPQQFYGDLSRIKFIKAADGASLHVTFYAEVA